MHTLVRTSLKYHFLVITLALVLMLVGVNQLGKMPVDSLPEFSPPYVEIQTEALGLSAEEVEQMITVPMEQDLLAGVAWLDVIHSESVPGLSSVVIYFEPGTDLYEARQMVAERLAQAAVGIPHVSKPPMMIQPTSSASRFMIVGLSSDELSLIEMSVLARWVIGPRLMGVPGVANVAIWGNRDQQLQVLVDPEHLREMGVTLEQVVKTTGNSLWVTPLSFLEGSTPGTGGFFESPNQRFGVWHVLPIKSPEDLAQVPVTQTALTLGDVTEIVEDHQPLIGDAIKNDSPNLLMVIEKLPGTNVREVSKGIDEAIIALRPGFSSIDFDASIYRPASFIEMAMANLTQTLVIAAILVTLVLGLFFFDWRTTLISLITIPMSLIAGLYVLHLQGQTLNAMVLAGLVMALGILIDDAIVDVDHIARRLRQNRSEGSPEPAMQVILDASTEIRGNLFFAFLVIALVILPVFFMQGVTGALFQPLGSAYLLAVLAAMIMALTVTPVLSLWLLSNIKSESRESPFVTRLQRGYENFLSRSVQTPQSAYAIIGILLVVSLVIFPLLKQDQTLPTFREPYITVRMVGKASTSRVEMNRIVTRVSSEIRGIAGVRNVAAHVGRAETGDQIVNVNSAELWVSIDAKADYDATLATIQDTVNGYPGLNREVNTYLQQTVTKPRSSRTGTDGAYTLRIYGDDHQVLRREVMKVQQVVAGINGVVDAHAILPIEEPTIEIEVDLSAAQRFGVKPGDVRRAAATLLSGLQVGSLFEEQKVFDVVVWSKPELRQSLTDINNLLIDTPRGGHVRLGEVAEVRIAPAPTVINREAISPYIDVAFAVSGRTVRAVLADVEAAMQEYPFPLEYNAAVQLDYLNQQQTQQGVLLSGIIAVIGVFLLLQAACMSWRMATATFLTLIASLSGGLLVLLLGGDRLSFASSFSLFAVLGIGVRTAISQIRGYHSLEANGEIFGVDLVLKGASNRFTATVMSALATALALLPFAIFTNSAGHELAGQLAIVLLGGVLTTTVLNLYALPALYLRFGEVRETTEFLHETPLAGEA